MFPRNRRNLEHEFVLSSHSVLGNDITNALASTLEYERFCLELSLCFSLHNTQLP